MSYGDRDPGAWTPAGAPLLGPAVSPRTGAGPATRRLDGPLPPFVGARALAVAEPIEAPEAMEPAEAPEPIEPPEPVEVPTPIETVEAPAPIEEQEMPPLIDPLDASPATEGPGPAEGDVQPFWGDEVAEPWAETPIPAEPTLSISGLAPADSGISDPGLSETSTWAPESVMPEIEQEEIVMDEPTWLDFDVADDVALVGEPVDATPGESEPLASESLIGDELLAPPAWEYGLDTTAQPEPTAGYADAPQPVEEPTPEPAAAAAAPAATAHQSPALEDVAARLEHIARSLRERNPAELLANADDPLQLLIAGYAMGLAARQTAQTERPGESPR